MLLQLSILSFALSSAENTAAVPVRVEAAMQLEIAPRTWLPGTVIGRYDSKIAAEVEGRLEHVAQVGDRVRRGDKLANIESFTLGLYVEEMQAEILPIQARIDYLQREVERLKELAQQNNAARNRLDEVTSQYRENTGQLGVVKARLAQAKDQLARTVIYAPFDGVVTERYKSEGERVEKGDQVVHLVNTADLEIQVRVPQNVIANLQKGVNLPLKDAHHSSEGRLRSYVPVGDALSRLFELRLDFNEADWMAGHAVRVSVPVSKPRQVIAVPRDALVIRQNNVSVFRINADNVAEFVGVKTGLTKDRMIEVIGALSVGDKIVIRGNERLRPGQSVTIQANDNSQ